MARLARAEVFDPGEVSVFHGINRCVRRCFLCGHDPLTGNNFHHRKRWLEDRFRFLEMASGKRGAIPNGLAPILSRLGIDPSNWLELADNLGRFRRSPRL